MRGRVTNGCIESLKEKLIDYVKEQDCKGSGVRSPKFRCFNSYRHNNMDRNHSAALVPGTGNKYWKCFACGAKGDVFKAVEYKEGIQSFHEKVKFVADRFNISLEYETVENETEKVYYYKDSEGGLLYKVTRTDRMTDGMKEKFFTPAAYINGSWVNGLKNTRRVLYNLPEMLKATRAGQIIYFVEGEKCAESLDKLGLCAVTVAGGVNGWGKYSSDFISYFKDADTVIIPDNDEPGKSLGKRVVQDIINTAKTVRYLELPGLKEKEDVADWIEKGGTAEKLQQLVDTLLEASLGEDPGTEEVETPIANDNLVFVVSGCYCRNVKKSAVSLTNFVIRPLYKIQSVDNEPPVIKAELVTRDGSVTTRHISTAAFDNVDLFRQTLNDTKFRYTGRIEELQHIKILVDEEVREIRKGVSFEGLHKLQDKWYVVSGEITVDEDLMPSDKLMLLEGSSELPTDILKAEAITAEELMDIAGSLFHFNNLRISATIIGYICGLYLKAKLQEVNIKYNHLLIEGHSGSGKSSALENIITPLLCMDSKSVLDASESTNFALHRGISSSNLVPLIIDEYKPRQIGSYKVNSISNLLRNSYDSHKSIKGVSTLSKNREFISRASIILSGEAGIDETANIERSLRAVFAAKNLNVETAESMEVLKLNRKLLDKLAKSILKGALKMKEEDIKKLHQTISDNLVDKSFTNYRVRNSIANCILGMSLLRKVFEELDLDFEKACGVKMKDIITSINSAANEDLLDNNTASKSIIEDTLETLNRMAANDQLTKGVDFDTARETDGELCLRLNYTVFYDRFIKYCKDYNVGHDVLSLNSFKKQLRKMDYCLCYNKPVCFRKSRYETREFKTSRAAVLSLQMLKARNLEIDFLVGDR